MTYSLDDIVRNYKKGLFLMDNGNGLDWYSSRVHALIPLDGRFRHPTSLRRQLARFEVRINADFESTMQGCAHSHSDGVWINEELKTIYRLLHQHGVVHSFETWQDGKLAGGILGLVLGKAFVGESMFYQVPEASKVAMVHLVAHLKALGFTLFDAQIQNPHLERFGAYEVPMAAYSRLLKHAVHQPAPQFNLYPTHVAQHPPATPQP